jgi:hypothetical protein
VPADASLLLHSQVMLAPQQRPGAPISNLPRALLARAAGTLLGESRRSIHRMRALETVPLRGTTCALPAGYSRGSPRMTALRRIIIAGACFAVGAVTPALLTRKVARHTAPPEGLAASSASPRHGEAATVPADAAMQRLREWVRKAASTPVTDKLSLDIMRYVIWALPASDYPRAWAFSSRLPPSDARDNLRAALLGYWAQVDPLAALKASGGGAEELKLRSDARRILSAWVEKDPSAALAWFRHHGATNDAASLALLVTWAADTDPAAAQAALSGIPPGALHDVVAGKIMKEWVSRNPTEAAAYLQALPATGERSDALQALGMSWARKDPAAALQWVAGLGDAGEQSSAVNGILESLGQTEPGRVAGLLNTLPATNLDINVSAVQSMVASWSARSLDDAKDWVAALPSGKIRDAALGTLLGRWCQQDPSAAATFASGLTAPKDAPAPVEMVLAQWAGTDPKGALDWAGSLPQGAARNAALHGALQSLATSDPAKAATYVAEMPQGDFQCQEAVNVASRWALVAPADAAAWVQEFPEGQAQQAAAGSVVRAWVQGGQPSAADQWMQQLPAGPARDEAARAFVRSAGAGQPALAAPWISAFTNDSERRQQIQTIEQSWLQVDPGKARAWLQSVSPQGGGPSN